MLRPEMNLPERSEFSSQALLLIRFQILYFSQIPEWNKDPTSHISVLFDSEVLNISCISESKFISVNPNCTFAGRISGKSVSSSACDVL